MSLGFGLGVWKKFVGCDIVNPLTSIRSNYLFLGVTPISLVIFPVTILSELFMNRIGELDLEIDQVPGAAGR